jgi:transcriptional regulator with XRE-family HTH domain
MERTDLIKSREYWIAEMQLKLFSVIETYQKENNLSRTQIAEKLGVTKGYISQILNGDFDHKISKLVDLSLAFNKVPLLNFIDLENYVANDAKDLTYDLIPMPRPRNITFQTSPPTEAEATGKIELTKFTPSFPQTANKGLTEPTGLVTATFSA